MQDAGIKTSLAFFTDNGVDGYVPNWHSQRPHQVGAIYDALACEVALPQERTVLVRCRLDVDGELEGRGEEIAPLFELVVQFRNQVWEADVV